MKPIARFFLGCGVVVLVLIGIAVAALRALRPGAAPGSRPALAAEALPPLPPLRELEPGVSFAEIAFPGPESERRQLWIYLPTKPKKPLGCVVIAPAGTRLFHGTGLGEGDRPEHLPYVRAGYAVVAYSLDGPLDEKELEQSRIAQKRIAAFISTEGGISSAKTAINYALSRLNVDPKRIVVAGHSSAATIALQVAAAEPRVKGCLAYAPCTDLEARLGSGLNLLDFLTPGAKAFLIKASPKNQVAQLHCPTLVFHARDDSNVPFTDSEQYVQQLKQAGGKVTFVPAESGDHYESMIQQGIPAGLKWLSQQGL